MKKQLVVEAIRNGTVIDHIPADRTLLVVELLARPDDMYVMGVNLGSTTMGRKGVIKMHDKVVTERERQVMAAIAPQATVNIVADYAIVQKFKLEVPERVAGIFACANLNCITNHEPVETVFIQKGRDFLCRHCERVFPVRRLKILRPQL